MDFTTKVKTMKYGDVVVARAAELSLPLEDLILMDRDSVKEMFAGDDKILLRSLLNKLIAEVRKTVISISKYMVNIFILVLNFE